MKENCYTCENCVLHRKQYRCEHKKCNMGNRPYYRGDKIPEKAKKWKEFVLCEWTPKKQKTLVDEWGE